jgi:DNA-binding beta-propeller fold protein YncE
MILIPSKQTRTLALLAFGLMIGPQIALPLHAADEPRLERVATIESKGNAGTLDHLFVDSATARLFLTNQTNNTLDVIDLKGRRLTMQVRGQETPHSVVYVPDLERIFVGCGGGACNVIDAKSNELAKSVAVDGADSVRYDARTGRVAVASRNSLTLIDARSLEIVATIRLPGTPHGFQIAKNRPRIYVNSEPPTLIAVVDSEKNEVVDKFRIGGDSKSLGPVVLDEASGRIFVGLRASPRFAVLDIDTGNEVATVPIPEGADDMSYDADLNRIFVSSSAGFITVIRQVNADRYAWIADLPTVKGAKTSSYDSALKQLYLAVPRQPDKVGPEIWVYQIR